MATARTVRQINRQRALRLLAVRGRISRAGLAQRLGMQRSTAGHLIAELEREGVICPADPPAGPPSRSAGRPGTDFALRPDHAHLVGIEIGVRHLRILARDFQGRIRHNDSAPMVDPPCSPDRVLDAVVTLTRETLARLRWSADAGLSLGVSFPGLVDRDGTVMRAPMLGWKGVSLMAGLRAAFPRLRDLIADNDANALATAEMAEGALRGRDYAVCLWLDDGIGGAVVAEGRLLRGRNGHAGEFGHMFARMSAPSATAGTRIEAALGRQALLDRSGAPSIAALEHDQAGGDRRAIDAIGQWHGGLAALTASLISAFDPETVLIGGPLSALVHPAELERRLAALLMPATPCPRVLTSQTGLAAAPLGMTIGLHDRCIAALADAPIGSESARA